MLGLWQIKSAKLTGSHNLTCTLLQSSSFHNSLLGVCHKLGAVLASQECPGVSDCPAIIITLH